TLLRDERFGNSNPCKGDFVMKPFAALKMTGVAAVMGLFLLASPQSASAEFLTDGRLTTDSRIGAYGANCYYQVYNVNLKAGRIYVIDLKSRDFDAYLYLLDPSGNILAWDDDSGGNLDARIVFNAQDSGTYRIVVTTYAPFTTGAFRLRVTP